MALNTPTNLKAMSGYLFLGISVVCFGLLAYSIWRVSYSLPDFSQFKENHQLYTYYGISLMPATALFIAALTSAFVGSRLLTAAGNANRQIIPLENKELIESLLREKKEDG